MRFNPVISLTCSCISDLQFSLNTLSCFDPVHSEWMQWLEWGSCTVKCGGGQRRRFRTCGPTANNNGRPCIGPDQETEGCNSQKCAGIQSAIHRNVQVFNLQFTEMCRYSICNSQKCAGIQSAIHRNVQVFNLQFTEMCRYSICNSQKCAGIQSAIHRNVQIFNLQFTVFNLQFTEMCSYSTCNSQKCAGIQFAIHRNVQVFNLQFTELYRYY